MHPQSGAACPARVHGRHVEDVPRVTQPSPPSPRQVPLVLALGTAQTLAWASSYYLPAILADPMAKDLSISTTWLFALVSAALVLSGLLGPWIGRRIDAVGGRQVLAASSLFFAAGLTTLGLAGSLWMLTLGWLLLGAGMGLGLYDAAFGALGRIYGDKARPAITGVTLLGGFASTVGWPLSALGLETIGWRDTCLAWAAAHIVLGLPLNLLFIPRITLPPRATDAPPAVKPHIPIDRTMVLLGIALASGWIVAGAMAAHLPRILMAAGTSATAAIAAGAFIGPAQVAARLMEAGLLRRFHPLSSARLACLTHPAGVLVLMLSGGAASIAFATLHGLGNGIITIARGTLPLAIYGPANYAYRLGLLAAPSRLAQALTPLVFSLLLDAIGSGVLLVSATISLAGFAALLLVNPATRTNAP
jgi:MFS family permease